MHLSAQPIYFSYRSASTHYITNVYTSTRPGLNVVVHSHKRNIYGEIETPLYDRLGPSTHSIEYKIYTAVEVIFIYRCGSAATLAPHYNRVLDGGIYIYFYFYDSKYKKLWWSCSKIFYLYFSCLFAVLSFSEMDEDGMLSRITFTLSGSHAASVFVYV